jgi:type IX secretion system substrate protein
MLIYPNPTDGRFILELAGEQEADLSLEIFDQTGKLFLQHVFPSHSAIREEFDLSSKPAGIYFLRIYHDSDHAIGKLILH